MSTAPKSEPFSDPTLLSASGSRIQGNSMLSEAFRARDWSLTPLGPIESWSQTLLATVNNLLLSPFSFGLYWGEQLTLLYNDVYCQFLAGKHPDALGCNGAAVWPEAWSVIGPPIESAFRDGTVTNVADVHIPVMIDGRLEQRWWTYCFYPIYDGDRIVGVANIGHDATPAVLATRELRSAESRSSAIADELSQVMDATTDAIVGVNRDWKITYLNPQAKAMYAAGRELVGKDLWQQFPDAIYEDSPYVKAYEGAMYDRVAGHFEAYYPEPLNIWIRLSVYPTRDGIATFSKDITEEKRRSALLIQNEKLAAVGKLASSIAHEINNPLEAVTNLLYLARQSEDVSDIHSMLTTADEELRRVSLIAIQTLAFHKQASKPKDVTCLDLFSSVLTMYKAKLTNAGIVVERRKRANKPVTIYEGDIRQVLNNLIGNAIDAMPQGGRLIVRSRECQDPRTGARGLCLTVADTGIGIPAEKQARIFEAFFTTKGIGGTGLGLWISRDIMERHGGKIRIRSTQREGQRGTVATLFLPFSNPLTATARPAAETGGVATAVDLR